MKFAKDTRGIERYIAMDIHKEYVLMGGQNARQEWVMQPRRVGVEKMREWAAANLRRGDAVILETTTNVWDVYDIVAPLVNYTVVAHAGKVRQIAEARVKTDKKDIERLICLLIADIVPEVWVPPTHVRELRGMISYRNRLVKTSTMIRNRLQSLIHRHNLILPKGALTDQAWWEAQRLSPLEKIQIHQEIALLEQIDKHKAEVDAELARQSLGEVWGKSAMRLLQLSGFGVIITMTILSAIGDIFRFESSNKLVGYSGLGAGVHDSGKEHIEKHITKEGRKELRWAGGRACRDPGGSRVARHPHFAVLERAVREVPEADAQTATGDRCDRTQTIGGRLARADERRNRCPRERRRPGVQDVGLGVGPE